MQRFTSCYKKAEIGNRVQRRQSFSTSDTDVPRRAGDHKSSLQVDIDVDNGGGFKRIVSTLYNKK